MLLEKENPFPKDKNIFLDEKTHIYYVNDKAYRLSVTSFVHKFFEKFDPDKIIEKYYNSWQSNPNNKYFQMTKDEIKKLWSSTEASELGTKMHRDIELFYNKILETEPSSIEFKYFKNFTKDFSNLIPYRTEWMVYDEDLRLAGSIDMVFKDTEDNLYIFDWKRSKEIKENGFNFGYYPLTHIPDTNYWHYNLQLNIYKKILEKNYDKKIKELNLVILHPNKKNYEIIKCTNLQKEVDLIFNERIEKIRELKKKIIQEKRKIKTLASFLNK